jgi:Carboxypeptidase regulatory-like domain
VDPRAVARSLAARRGTGTAHSLRLCGVLIATSLVCLVPASAVAQQPTDGHEIRSPDLIPHSSGQITPDAEASANITGIVTDASSASVTGAEVSLSDGDGTSPRTTTTGTSGEFRFTRSFPVPTWCA